MLALALVLGACGTESNPLTPQSVPVPGDIARACELASHRCARCHSLDRIVRARIDEPVDWRRYVHRMRLMPGSAIPPAEEPTLVRCLVFRVAGRAGLARLGETEGSGW